MDGDGPSGNHEELRVIYAALHSFVQYRRTCHYNATHRRRQNFYALPTRQWQQLAAHPIKYLDTLSKVDDAIDVNSEIADHIVRTACDMFSLDVEAKEWQNVATPLDLEKARSTIGQFYRDWSAEGSLERKCQLGPVLKDIDDMYGSAEDRSVVKILVPGAGLGRMVFELCKAGYCVEGNEISYHQLMASNWILNHTQPEEKTELYPFVMDFNNVIRRTDQLIGVHIPDIHPGSELHGQFATPGGQMSMTAADFLLLYSNEDHRGMFDAVATIFFIDTAPNLIRYIETVHHCLKNGGTWSNLGPLLWHFGDRASQSRHNESHSAKPALPPGGMPEKQGIEAPGSFELCGTEVLSLVESMGFSIIKGELLEDGIGYMQSPRSMLQKTYKTSHWVARKVAMP